MQDVWSVGLLLGWAWGYSRALCCLAKRGFICAKRLGAQLDQPADGESPP